MGGGFDMSPPPYFGDYMHFLTPSMIAAAKAQKERTDAKQRMVAKQSTAKKRPRRYTKEQLWQIFVLHYEHGKPHNEIQKETGIGLSSIYNLLAGRTNKDIYDEYHSECNKNGWKETAHSRKGISELSAFRSKLGEGFDSCYGRKTPRS